LQKKDEQVQGLEKEAESGGEILEQNKLLLEEINKLHKDIKLYEI
jgi:hypothetical protein